MAVEVKICGLRDSAALTAAATGGARYLGFMLYAPSPRAVTLAEAAALVGEAPARCATVGVLVDPDDRLLDGIGRTVRFDYLQLHGNETPARVAEVKARTGRGVIKALRIADAADLEPIAGYAEVADLLLFDARPPRVPGSLPGGNGLSFDWRLLQGFEAPKPWLLAGGLSADNLADAVRLCGAGAVDVSSGVEDRPGHKDPARITAFLELAARLGAPA